MRVKWILAATAALVAACALCRPVRSDDEKKDPFAEVRAQVRKVLDLMKGNEKALLAASTGAAATPTKPEIEIPAANAAPPEGKRIPRELEELARIWPT